MKHIQSFKIFESVRVNMVIDQIKEILLPLEDEGLSINITTNQKASPISKGLAKVILGVEIPEIVIQTSVGHITNGDSPPPPTVHAAERSPLYSRRIGTRGASCRP